jgi:membrane protein DedA with SNARE-associated domain
MLCSLGLLRDKIPKAISSMGQDILDFLRNLIAQYGYWAVGGALLLENAGIPVPGETILLLASFLAYSRDELQLPYIIVIGVLAATLGDNFGFAIGYRGGRPLLDRYKSVFRIKPETIARGETMFAQYGALTIFFARFIFGLRVIAGPLAGVLRMPWKRFAIFNFLGALLWVTVISLVGYKFGKHWDLLMEYVERLNIVMLIAVGIGIVILWLWRRRRRS